MKNITQFIHENQFITCITDRGEIKNLAVVSVKKLTKLMEGQIIVDSAKLETIIETALGAEFLDAEEMDAINTIKQEEPDA
jgi:hypothetical protein